MKTVAFIGLGVMGSRMANRIIDAGYQLQVYEVFREKAQPLIDKGARFCDTISEVSNNADAVISMLGYPKDVESVYFGESGVINSAAPGTLIIEMTTSSPSLANMIYFAAKEKGIYALDAPVSGGDVGAQSGKLSIMVGGDEDAFEMAKPLLDIMGSTVTLCGRAGMGQNTKMANQIAVACNVSAVAESFAYAKATGLDPEVMFRCVCGGAGSSWQMNVMAPKMIAGDDSAGFFIRHLIKDMDIALQEANQYGRALPLLSKAREMFGKLAENGMENCGTQAIYHYYDE